MFDCPQGKLGPIGDPQFAEDVVEVFLYSADGQAELVGDFFIRFCLTDELHDLFFARGQLLQGSPGPSRTVLTGRAQILAADRPLTAPAMRTGFRSYYV